MTFFDENKDAVKKREEDKPKAEQKAIEPIAEPQVTPPPPLFSVDQISLPIAPPPVIKEETPKSEPIKTEERKIVEPTKVQKKQPVEERKVSPTEFFEKKREDARMGLPDPVRLAKVDEQKQQQRKIEQPVDTKAIMGVMRQMNEMNMQQLLQRISDVEAKVDIVYDDLPEDLTGGEQQEESWSFKCRLEGDNVIVSAGYRCVIDHQWGEDDNGGMVAQTTLPATGDGVVYMTRVYPVLNEQGQVTTDGYWIGPTFGNPLENTTARHTVRIASITDGALLHEHLGNISVTDWGDCP